MARPDRIRVPYFKDDSRFGLVGKYDADKQFIAFVAGAYPKNWSIGTYSPTYLEYNWEQHKRWYAVLHRSDAEGNHIGTEAWSGGTSAEGEGEACGRASTKLEEMVRSLGSLRFCDINVKTFGVEINGYFFGLVYEFGKYGDDDPANPEGTHEWVKFEPNGIMFHPPWDSGEWSS